MLNCGWVDGALGVVDNEDVLYALKREMRIVSILTPGQNKFYCASLFVERAHYATEQITDIWPFMRRSTLM